MQQGIFSFGHIGPMGKQQHSFLHVSGKNGTRSCKWVAKVLFL